ncbi:MAG: hypothetical protein RIT10_492 [Bacteroidota bacterium]|jgi:hypothetical protein
MKKLLFFTLTILSFSVYSQYCTTSGPTSTADSNVKKVRIIGVGDSISYNYTCPGIIGLLNLTSYSTTLNAGSNYNLQVQYGTCGGNYLGYGQVWIDFDHNETFDAWESVGTWNGTPPVAITNHNFSIPVNAQNGPTRMRVIQREGANQTFPLDPCASFTWGSAMDFTINIQNGIDCSAYPGDEMADAIPVTTLPFIDTRNSSFCYSNQNYVYNSPDVYYALNPNPMMNSITASLCGSTFDTFLSVVDATGNVIAYNDDDPYCGNQSALTFSTSTVGLCYLVVEGWGASAGDYTLTINASYLGMEDETTELLKIYPNPAKSNLTIEGIEGQLTIFAINGEKVMNASIFNITTLDISELSSGFYTLSFTSNSMQFTKKLTIE